MKKLFFLSLLLVLMGGCKISFTGDIAIVRVTNCFGSETDIIYAFPNSKPEKYTFKKNRDEIEEGNNYYDEVENSEIEETVLMMNKMKAKGYSLINSSVYRSKEGACIYYEYIFQKE